MSTLLKLQIGPVQEFIAQARSTRDLWSGSYLLSWLMASGLNELLLALAEAGVGDNDMRAAIIYPRPELQPLMQRGQPKLFCEQAPVDRRILNNNLLTPNIPNILLARVPGDLKLAQDLAKRVEHAICSEWETIGEHCWLFCKKNGLVSSADEGRLRQRFDRQRRRFISIAWQVTDDTQAQHLATMLPLSQSARKQLEHAPSGFAASLAANAWQLDAVRQVRTFWGWSAAVELPGSVHTRDCLTGREERIVGGSEWWKNHVNTRQPAATLFRERHRGDELGAISLIKRVWHLAYLKPEHGLHAGHDPEWREVGLPFPSTFHIASHDPAKNEDDPRELAPDDLPEGLERYFAVLTMDGDQMGRWMSGENFTAAPTPEKLSDFSARLANFGLRCARPIVEACDGRLVYAGGDDVVALLPADTALSCAQFLRAAYAGKGGFLGELQALAVDLLKRHTAKAKGRKLSQEPDDYFVSPFLQAASSNTLELAKPEEMPGQVVSHENRHADVSAGLAIAHFKAPLQDVVRAAQAAEKRAKKQPLDRSAVAVTLMKRSGETIEWGCKWESGGLELLAGLQEAMAEKKLSAKFPHRVIALLTPYLNQQTGLAKMEQVAEFDSAANEVIRREFGTALERQHGECWPEEAKAARELTEGMRDKLDRYLAAHDDAQQKLKAIIGLCQTVAFAHRTADEESTAERQLAP